MESKFKMNTFRFPSLLPPCYEPEKEKSDLLDVQVLERKEKEYKQWLASLYECPYHSPAGLKQTDYDPEEVEEEESLEDSSDVDNDISVFEDSSNAFVDELDSSLQDNSLINDTP